jgi:hypothetical protein
MNDPRQVAHQVLAQAHTQASAVLGEAWANGDEILQQAHDDAQSIVSAAELDAAQRRADADRDAALRLADAERRAGELLAEARRAAVAERDAVMAERAAQLAALSEPTQPAVTALEEPEADADLTVDETFDAASATPPTLTLVEEATEAAANVHPSAEPRLEDIVSQPTPPPAPVVQATPADEAPMPEPAVVDPEPEVDDVTSGAAEFAAAFGVLGDDSEVAASMLETGTMEPPPSAVGSSSRHALFPAERTVPAAAADQPTVPQPAVEQPVSQPESATEELPIAQAPAATNGNGNGHGTAPVRRRRRRRAADVTAHAADTSGLFGT